jgi:hypothetical protein
MGLRSELLFLWAPTDRDFTILDGCSSGLGLLGRPCCLSRWKPAPECVCFGSVVLSEGVRVLESIVPWLLLGTLEGLSFFEVVTARNRSFWLLLRRAVGCN